MDVSNQAQESSQATEQKSNGAYCVFPSCGALRSCSYSNHIRCPQASEPESVHRQRNNDPSKRTRTVRERDPPQQPVDPTSEPESVHRQRNNDPSKRTRTVRERDPPQHPVDPKRNNTRASATVPSNIIGNDDY